MTNILKSRQVDPDDSLAEMLAEHVSVDYERFEVGTLYRPLCGGYDNVTNRAYIDISISGRKVRFLAND